MNRMTIYITAGLLLVGLVAYFFLKSKQKSSTADYFISTQSQSNERVKNLNLDTPSEDASYILDTTKLSFPAIKRQNAEYKANPDKDWVIDLPQGENAIEEYKNQFPTDLYIFNERLEYGLKCIKADRIPEITMDDFTDDIYVSHHNMKWTFVLTHEIPDIGPFFAN